MITQDFHIHTSYCDGKNTPDEIIQRAIELNMKKIGLVCHSYTYFDESYCIKRDDVAAFISEVRSASQKYSEKIEVLCGVEQDYYSDEPIDNFDFVIGSVHYVRVGSNFLDVDNTKEQFISQVKEHYNGDYVAFCEAYFKTISDVAEKTKCDIIGHFDLITKFNEANLLFDTNDKRYEQAAYAAVDNLLKYNIPFEINTGAISRGYRSEAYPENKYIEYILQKGGRVVLSSDSHSVGSLCCEFDKYEKFIK